MIDFVLGAAAEYPIVLFLLIAILPAVGFPNCPLLIGGGAIVARSCGIQTALGMAIAGVIVNILYTYWLAASPMRKLVWKGLERRAPWFVNVEGRSIRNVTLLLHLTPGIPLFVQNYYPGIHRLPYWEYLLIAVPIQSLYTFLIVYTSGSVAAWLSPAWLVAALIAVFVCTWIRGMTPLRQMGSPVRSAVP